LKIGRIVRVLEDKEREETLVECAEKRKIVISFYYPADESWGRDGQALYSNLYSPREDKFFDTFKNMITIKDDLDKTKFLENLKTNIYNEAPICNKPVTYPVIIQSTGLGSPRDYMTFNIEKLVSAGYVVFTIGHTYDSMLTVLPNGEVIEPAKNEITQDEKVSLIDVRKNDILFMLNELERLNNEDDVIKNKLNLSRIGIIGHSLGGSAVFKAAQCDSRIKAAVLFDASLHFLNLSEAVKNKQTLSTPVLNFRRGTFDYETSMQSYIDFMKNNLDSDKFKQGVLIYDSILRDSKIEQKNLFNYLSNYKSFIRLNSSKHMVFTDYSLIKGEKMESEHLTIEKAHEVINDLTTRFLDEFLCGKLNRYSGYIKNDYNITLIDEDGGSINASK
jgi:dienelactone hydrolase